MVCRKAHPRGHVQGARRRTLKETSVIYGEEPLLTAELAYDDVIRCVAFAYDYTQTEAEISPDAVEIRVFDRAGEDVTSSYSFRSVEGELLIEQRAVSVSTESATKVYDGTPLTRNEASNATVAEDTPLAENDALYIDTAAEGYAAAAITDVGTAKNSLAVLFKKTVSLNGKETVIDVTSNYEITYTYGTLEVTARPLLVGTETDKAVYDGQGHSNSEHWWVQNAEDYTEAFGEVQNGGFGLLESLGHSMTAENVPSFTDVLHDENGNVIGHENAFTVRVFADGGDTDVSDNYDIQYIYGEYIITPRPVTFVTESESFVYDGQPHSESGFFVAVSSETPYGLVNGHMPKVSENTYVTDVADSGTENRLTIGIFEGETDKSANYNITYKNGTLTVTPRPVLIGTATHSWVYDGTAQTDSGSDAMSDEAHREYSEWAEYVQAAVAAGSFGLVSGHSSVWNGEGTLPSVTNVGEGKVENKFAVNISAGGADVTKNYYIVYSYGTLEVTPRHIKVTAASGSKVYDGLPFSRNDFADGYYFVTSTEDPAPASAVAEGQDPRVETKLPEGTDVYTNGAHTLAVDGVTVWADGVNVTENYDITTENGKVSITHRYITVCSDDGEKMYDGTPLTAHGCTLTEGSLAAGQELVPSYTGSITNVWESAWGNNTFTVSILAGGSDVTKNYSIAYSYGTLTVTQRPITVTADSGEKVYDGTPLAVDTFKVTSEYAPPLVLDHKAIAEIEGTDRVDVYENAPNRVIEVRITSADGQTDVTGNYAIETVAGTLSITKRPVLIGTATYSWVYDGTAHSDEESFEESDGAYAGVAWGEYAAAVQADSFGLLSGHTSKWDGVSALTSITDVGEKENIFAVAIWAGGSEVTKNYYIAYSYGTLTVTKRPVLIETATHSWVYDGKPHSDSGSGAMSAEAHRGYSDWGDYVAAVQEDRFGLVSGHYSAWNGEGTLPSVTNVREGDVQNTFAVNILAGGADVTDNYYIAYSYGTLTVTKRHIHVTAASDSKVYDGLPFSRDDFANGYYIVTSTEAPALDPAVAEGQKLQVSTQLPGSANVYTGGTHTVLSVTVLQNNVNVTENYEITTGDGTVSITLRPVLIGTATHSWVYDGQPHSDSGSKAMDEAAHRAYSAWGDYAAAVEAGSFGLVSGHYSAWDGEGTLPSVTNVWEGKVQNKFAVNILADGTDVTDNYYIAYSYGTLEITPRPILIETATDGEMYDGLEHSNGGYDWLRDAADYTEIFGQVQEGEFGLLVSLGHSMKEEKVPSFTDVLRNEDGNVIGHENAFTVRIFADGDTDVSKNYDIQYIYGKYTITPRPVTFVTEGFSWVYDGTAHSHGGHSVAQSSEYPLVDGHTSKAVGFTYVTNVAESGRENALTIGIFEGETDKSANYNITYEYGTLAVTPRPVLIGTATQSWVYDGQPHTDSGSEAMDEEAHREYGDWGDYTEAVQASSFGLVNGHYSVWDGAGALPSVTNVWDGKVPNTFAVKIWADGTDVTDNYYIAYSYGTLEITPRKIVVTAGSGEKEYDGTPLVVDTFTVTSAHEPPLDPAVVQGHIVTAATEGCDLTDVYENQPNRIVEGSVHIYAGEGGQEVTQNYDIRTEDGTLTILPRKITVTAGSSTKVYDGKALTDPQYFVTLGSTLEGHTLTAVTEGSQTEAGQSPNVVASVSITDADGVSVMKNYDVTRVDGTLTVTPRPITIVTGSKEWVYDGQPHSWYEDENGDPTYYILTGEDKYGLVDGQQMRVKAYTEITLAGEKENALTIGIYAGDEKKTQNYAITYQNGTLKVTPRTITIVTGSNTWVYDGQPHSETRYEVKGELVEGDEPSVALATEVTDVTAAPVENELTIAIFNGDTEVTTCYQIKYENGTLEVTPRHIKVTAANGTKVYDGLPFSQNDFADGYYTVTSTQDPALDPAVAEGQRLQVLTQLPEGADVYTDEAHTLTVDDVTVWADGVNVTANYVIETENGKVSITQRHIKVTAASSTKVYDGEPFTKKNFAEGEFYTITSEEEDGIILANGQHAEVEMEAYSLPDVRLGMETNNHVKDVKVLQGTKDVTGNYEIEKEDGVLRITPRPITVVTGDGYKKYNGEPLTNPNVTVISELSPALVEGHVPYCTPTGSQTEIGYSQNTLKAEDVVIRTGSGEDVTKNYAITVDEGLLQVVHEIVITIHPYEVQKYYNGELQTYNANDYWVEWEEGAPAGWTVKLLGLDTIGLTDVGTVKVEDLLDLEAEVRNEQGELLTKNEDYSIVIDDSALFTVKPCEITVTSASASKQYDGTALTADTWWISSGSLAYGHDMTVEITGSIVDVGTTSNAIGSCLIYDKEGNDVTKNYVITRQMGSLTVF